MPPSPAAARGELLLRISRWRLSNGGAIAPLEAAATAASSHRNWGSAGYGGWFGRSRRGTSRGGRCRHGRGSAGCDGRSAAAEEEPTMVEGAATAGEVPAVVDGPAVAKE